MNTVGAVAPGSTLGRILTWPARHIRWKIVLPYAILTVLLAAAGSYLVTRLVTGSLEERFDNQLVEAGRVVADATVRTERGHLEVVRAVSFTKGVPEAVGSGDTADLRALVEPIAANASVERLEVLSSHGQRLTALSLADGESLTYEEIEDADDPTTWPIVERVLAGQADERGDKYAQIVETAGGFVFYTAGPISDEDGKLVGLVLAGTTIPSFAARAKAEALADVTFYDFNGAPLGTTFAAPDAASAGEARLDVTGEVLAAATAGETVREHRTLWGRGYDQVYGRLELRGQAVGLYSVGLPTDFIFSAGSATRTQVALLFGIGMAAVLGMGLFVAHRLTQPILRLVRAARLVASGDLTSRSGVTSADEIGTLASSFDEMTDKLQRQHLSTIKALTSAIDARDPYTLGHSVRVGQLAVMIGRHLGLDERTLSNLEVGGYLHDIGKIGIRDAILLKPSGLTDEERQVIHDHPRIGMAILDPVDLPDEVLQFVEGHHERLDGTGYPHGLSDTQVTMVRRIAAVSDMYDAITSDRPYRDPMVPEAALALLRSEAGRTLDTDVVEALASLLGDWESRRAEEPELQGFKLPELEPKKVPV
jgi:putative nucleotidyltransferase with HDIG domain